MSSTSHEGFTALSSTFLVLSVVAVGLRFYARYKAKTHVKADDWIMIPCLVGQYCDLASLEMTDQAVALKQLVFIGTVTCTFYGQQEIQLCKD